ncbi:hypothetical protein [Brachybacterium hainanense]|uniref:DUF559 domain-containing protein n=1 Tax=Brachybacterium hainanense TaxID=1541174 RepID=A0ABV6R7S8_9MICO
MRSRPDHDPVPALEMVLVHAARCLPPVQAAVLLESAVHRGQMGIEAARPRRRYDEDRDRDLYLRSLGYHVTRLTWEQVSLRWPQTELMLLRILRRGEHRRRLPP